MKTTKRVSNFELLRIIAIFIIILHHYCVHGQQWYETTCINSVITQTLGYFGKIGVALFVLITGYFNCEKNFNLKRLVLLIAETVFYSQLIYWSLYFISPASVENFKLSYVYFPIFHGTYWFISYYFILYLFSPVLNAAIKNFSHKKLSVFLMVAIFLYSLNPLYIDYDNPTFSMTIIFVILYFLGAYVKKYDVWDIKIDVVALSSLIIIAAVYAVSGATTAVNQYFYAEINEFFIIGICFFMLSVCKKIKPFYNGALNLVAKTAFGVYLIHDNILFRDFLWVKLLKCPEYAIKSTGTLILHLFLSCVIVFTVCCAVDLVRIYLLEKPLDKLLTFISEKYHSSSLKRSLDTLLDKIYEENP